MKISRFSRFSASGFRYIVDAHNHLRLYGMFLALVGTFQSLPLQASVASSIPVSQIEENIWLLDSENLRDVEQEAVRIVQMEPHSALGHYLLAEIYLRRFKGNPSQLKLLQQASDLGQQAIELDPSGDYGYLVAAQVLDLMGYTESALGALEGNPNYKMIESWRVPFLKAQLKSGLRSEPEVLINYEESLRKSGSLKNVIVPYIIASLQSKQTNKHEIIDELNTWRAKYPHKLFDLTLAIALTEKKKYQEAHALYARLQASDPLLYEAFINDAIVSSNYLGNPEEAIKLLKVVINAKDRIDTNKRNLAKAHLARIYIEGTKRIPEGKIILSEVIRDTSSPSEWLVFGQRAFEKSKQMKEFVSFLDDVEKISPGSGFIYALKGEILSENLALHDQAIESFRSAIILEPNRSDFYNGLGLAYYRMNEMQKALYVFHEATRIDPKDATSRYNEACVLALLGRSDEAIGSLKAAIELDPKLQNSAKSDNDLKSLWNTPDFQSIFLKGSSALTGNVATGSRM